MLNRIRQHFRDFNPRSPYGERRRQITNCRSKRGFQSTLPIRGATYKIQLVAGSALRFQSTLPIRGATASGSLSQLTTFISIHAPHTGSDEEAAQFRDDQAISIHAPHTGSDKPQKCNHSVPTAISIHAPHTGSDYSQGSRLLKSVISIHAPHTGSDLTVSLSQRDTRTDFNPRSPYGERQPISIVFEAQERISIHAPHTGSDGSAGGIVSRRANFNPRSPYGERLFCRTYRTNMKNFNPRSPYGERQL